MSEAAERAVPDLNELAAVTAEYPKYSRTMFGFAVAGTGAWLLASLWVRWAWSQRGGDMLALLTPIVWMLMLAPARAYYQRHGEVVEQEGKWSMVPGRPVSLFAVWMFSVFGTAASSAAWPR
jgi:hypothetical protein